VSGCKLSGVEIQDGASLVAWRSSFSDGNLHGVTVEKAHPTFRECEALRNRYTGIMVHGDSAPDIANCELSHNRHSGAYFSQGSSGTMIGCHIAHNKGNGVRIKGSPTIRGNVIEGNVGGIGMYGEKEQPIISDNVIRDNEETSALLRRAGDRFCTFFAAGPLYLPQRWFQCKTCCQREEQGVCEICAKTCHLGHELGRPRFSGFYCDCPSWGHCMALPPGNGLAAQDKQQSQAGMSRQPQVDDMEIDHDNGGEGEEEED
jgi:hypothetical protein